MNTEPAYEKDCLMTTTPRPHCLRFMPALNSSPAQIAEGLVLLRKVFREMQ